MQTAANNSLIFNGFSSFKRLTDSESAISLGGFYQQLASGLIRDLHKEIAFRECGERLVVLAEHAHAFRQTDLLEQVSQILMSAPLPRQYEYVGRYYRALGIHRFGGGNVEQATKLLEGVAEEAPPRYRPKAMLSMGSMFLRIGDNRGASYSYCQASRFASRNGLHDRHTTIQAQRMFAVINSVDGNHRDALTLLENLFPLAHAIRSVQPHIYYDYLNSLAVELCEVGRLLEAKNVSRIVLSSPFASAYPEWRETHDEIKLRGLRASRSVVAISKTIAEVPFSQPTVDTFVSLAPLEGANVVRLPLANRGESPSVPVISPGQPARVFSIQEWKEKIAKQQNDDPRKRRPKPTTTKEQEARIEELEKLTSREVLMKIMDNLGDERVGEELLRKALIILEDLEPDENHGA